MVKTEIPKGFKTLLQDETKVREAILRKIEEVVSLWGYREISPPTIEYLSTFKLVGEDLEEVSFKLVDRFTGKLMAVRPDFTPQVARIVASSFKDDEPPFRFFYKGKIFRDIDSDREQFQFGLELIGVSHVEADAEIVAIVANVLENLGLKSFQIDIGSSEFIEGVIEELEIDDKDTFLKLLRHKDLSGIEIFIEEKGIGNDKKKKVEALLELYGKEEVLDEALKIFKNEKSQKAVFSLKEMFSILKTYGFEKKVIFDLSEKRGMEYHTGFTFEVFHPLFGFSLGGGGRYNELLSKFGRPLPATGIALNIDAIQELLEKKGVLKTNQKLDFYIVDLKKELFKAHKVAKLLREKGFSVARDIVKRDLESSLKVAFNKGFEKVIVLNAEGLKENECLIFEKGECEPIKITIDKLTNSF
jgi:ATP phosphoribosyltransferase regulatory subunit